jgi:hypothetical protein
MLPLLLSCFCAYIVAEYLKDLPIYEALLQRDLNTRRRGAPLEGRSGGVHIPGGMAVRWPRGALARTPTRLHHVGCSEGNQSGSESKHTPEPTCVSLP